VVERDDFGDSFVETGFEVGGSLEGGHVVFFVGVGR
jgi:hypothetical protein